MYVWVMAVVSIALVAGVLGFSVMSASAAVESRVLVIGFLAFFAISLVAGAGLLPIPTLDDASQPVQSAYLMKSKGESQ